MHVSVPQAEHISRENEVFKDHPLVRELPRGCAVKSRRVNKKAISSDGSDPTELMRNEAVEL